MNKKTRTDEQKARRAYLDFCKKEGKKPMDIETWRSTLAQKAKDAIKNGKFKSKTLKIVKVEKKPAEKNPANKKETAKVIKPNVHVIHKGDIIKFEDFSPLRVLDYGLKIAYVAWCEVKRMSLCQKKCK